MEIRKATAADLDGVEAIYNAVLDHQAATVNYTNWEKGSYPTRATAEKALAEGTLYVQSDGDALVGCAVFNHEQLPEYANIDWLYPAEGDQVMVIHTLCIHPAASGRGLAKALVAYAVQLGRAQGCTVMRFDTYEGNLPARALYTGLGYRLAGGTEFFFQGFIHEILVLFEKEL